MEVSVSDITSDAFVIPWALHGFFRDLDIFSVFSFETLVRKILSDLAIGSSELLFFLALGSNSAWNAWPCRGDLAVGTLPWSLQSLSFGHGHSFNENLGFGHLAIEVCPTCKGEGCFFSTATLFFLVCIYVNICICLYLSVSSCMKRTQKER